MGIVVVILLSFAIIGLAAWPSQPPIWHGRALAIALAMLAILAAALHW